MSDRTAERLEDGKWVPVKRPLIKEGDIVRMREVDGTLDPLTEHGVKVTRSAFLSNGEWCFQADMNPKKEKKEPTKSAERLQAKKELETKEE